MTSGSEPGTSNARTFWIAGSICVVLFAFSFVAGPKSCEWGLTAYFWTGIAALVALFAVPMVLRTDRTMLMRSAFGLAFAVGGLAVWIAGLAAGNVRIMCRLF